MAKYKKIKAGPGYHLGNSIVKKIEERGITKSEFGRMLDLSRQNVQDVLRRESMDTSLLGKISKALDYDFFKELSKKLNSSGE